MARTRRKKRPSSPRRRSSRVSSSSLIARLDESVAFIREKTSLRPKIGVTLGSGLASFVDAIDVDVALPYAKIPHFSPPTIEGHPGQLVIGHINDVPVAVLQGRIHFYEGHSMQQVAYLTQTLGRLGIEQLVLTNAAGGVDPNMRPGDFMLITDHINLTGTNPLIGPNVAELGPRFPDMSQVYDAASIERLEKIMKQLGLRYSKGVYCGVLGPSYETAAEIRYLRTIGGSAVGMSTVPEAIAAAHMGLKLSGISCITNLGTGITEQKITHDEVKEIAKKVESNFARVLKEFITQIGKA